MDCRGEERRQGQDEHEPSRQSSGVCMNQEPMRPLTSQPTLRSVCRSSTTSQGDMRVWREVAHTAPSLLSDDRARSRYLRHRPDCRQRCSHRVHPRNRGVSRERGAPTRACACSIPRTRWRTRMRRGTSRSWQQRAVWKRSSKPLAVYGVE